MKLRSWENVSFGDAPHLGQSRFFSHIYQNLFLWLPGISRKSGEERRLCSSSWNTGCLKVFYFGPSLHTYIPCPGDSHKTKPNQIYRQILVKPFLLCFTDMRDKRHVARSLAAIFKSFTPNHNQYIWSSSKLSSNLWTITPFEDRSLAITKVITPSVSKIS